MQLGELVVGLGEDRHGHLSQYVDVEGEAVVDEDPHEPGEILIIYELYI